jgi:hypothetical protein
MGREGTPILDPPEPELVEVTVTLTICFCDAYFLPFFAAATFPRLSLEKPFLNVGFGCFFGGITMIYYM